MGAPQTRTPEEDLEQQFRTRGRASVDIGDLETSVDEWRSLARAAARRLGRPVQTIVVGDRIHASLRDWPANDLEKQIHDAELRRAMNAITLG